jgi:ABC-type transport system involved in cytochrome c biogenesis permease subunit
MAMNALLLLLYAAASVAYAVQFSQRTFATNRLATVLLVLAAFAHTFVIGMETMRVGHVPSTSATAAILSFVWLLALSYLYLELTTGERAMGVFILPLLVALQAIPTFGAASPEPRSPILESPWFGVHVSSLLFAYASFALAGVLGVTYVLQFKEIKAKDLGFFYERLPSLNVLDEMNLRAVKIGWLFLTVGLITGGIWASQLQSFASAGSTSSMSMADPKIFVAVLCWAVYSFELYAQRAIGWRGRRAAWLSAVGFVIVLLNFVPVSYFFTTSHNF